MLDALLRDARIGLRALRRTPAFSLFLLLYPRFPGIDMSPRSLRCGRDLDDVLLLIDHTASEQGRRHLYHVLRSPSVWQRFGRAARADGAGDRRQWRRRRANLLGTSRGGSSSGGPGQKISSMHDTSSEAAAIARAAVRHRAPPQRMLDALEFSEALRSLAVSRMRHLPPNDTPIALVERLTGESLALVVRLGPSAGP
jgi:hypothetical protein